MGSVGGAHRLCGLAPATAAGSARNAAHSLHHLRPTREEACNVSELSKWVVALEILLGSRRMSVSVCVCV